MSLFQTSVIKKYLSDLSPELIDKKYNEFQAYFGNAERQENIRNSKEEEYQSGFISALFVNILGYTLNPEPNFNIVLEKKNVDDSKKADGAIIRENEVIAVIELKSTQTTNLDSFRDQAFGYKNHNPKCVYVITSNFEKIRLYIHDTTNHLEFDLFNLSKENFTLLWLCFSVDNILTDIPLKIKEASVLQEENVTKKLYNDYSKFRKEIFNDIVKHNPEFDKLLLFKKTQKLLDRFLFIFFAEDRLLLPPNSISEIVKQWTTLKEDLDEYVPLYDRFKKYFGYLNTGFKGKKYDIFAYNGGLFLPDEILDNIKIDDEILRINTVQLSTYDFETDVDVNILGHIFEHSLGEIETVQAEIAGEEIDSQKTKRKKDGIFYTPKYITKYIVENTVGKLCVEKRIEFGIVDEEYAKGRRNRKKDIVKELDNKLTEYREWLLNITILDPACGSGAFLNQALEFLIEEHKKIDELKAQLLGGAIVFSDIEAKILEKNIYGVDLNQESVEIAKLSLWLRTAQKGRKLTTLSNHIKCGNSLIDDPITAGEKAFNWQIEFPEVFKNGGFDVIIGNPPYVDIKGLDNEFAKQLFEKFSTTENRINLYSIFIEQGFNLLKNGGFLSYINPNSILVNSSYTKIRKLLIDNITSIIKLPDAVFEDATVETIILEFRKNVKFQDAEVILYQKDEKISQIDKFRIQKISKKDWKETESNNYNIYVNSQQLKILKKIEKNTELNELAEFTLGITPYDKYKGHSPEQIKSRAFHADRKLDENYKPLISGQNITRYFVDDSIQEYINYGDWLGAMRDERFFTEPRILVRQIVSGNPPRIYAGFTDKPLYFTQIGFGIIPLGEKLNTKYLLALINSQLINFYHKYRFLDLEKELFQKILIANCKQLPIKVISLEEQNSFVEKVDSILLLFEDLKIKKTKFLNRLIDNFNIERITKKIDDFYNYDFKSLISELKKQNVELSLVKQDELDEYFNSYKTEINQIQSLIEKSDKDLDEMVYKLYDLTQEEIKTVKESY